MRMPQNVPALVDNLWEWRRPEGFPSRRFSACASPSAKLAEESAPGGLVCRVQLRGKFSLCQVQGWSDSKEHPECKTLPKLLAKLLGQPWMMAPLAEKTAAGRIWMPCLMKAEVESFFESVEALHQIRNEMWEAVNYWKCVVKLAAPDC